MTINKQQGFTIIELLAVIIVIGILSFVIISKYIDLSSDAQVNTTNNLATKLNSAARMNYYERKVNPNAGIPITNCKNVNNTMMVPLPSGYTITSKKVPVDTIVSCVLKGPDKTKANFYVRGIK